MNLSAKIYRPQYSDAGTYSSWKLRRMQLMKKKPNSYVASTISLNSFNQGGILHLPIPLKETYYMSTNLLKL